MLYVIDTLVTPQCKFSPWFVSPQVILQNVIWLDQKLFGCLKLGHSFTYISMFGMFEKKNIAQQWHTIIKINCSGFLICHGRYFSDPNRVIPRQMSNMLPGDHLRFPWKIYYRWIYVYNEHFYKFFAYFLISCWNKNFEITPP